jgi:hypothetical protein
LQSFLPKERNNFDVNFSAFSLPTRQQPPQVRWAPTSLVDGSNYYSRTPSFATPSPHCSTFVKPIFLPLWIHEVLVTHLAVLCSCCNAHAFTHQ